MLADAQGTELTGREEVPDVFKASEYLDTTRPGPLELEASIRISWRAMPDESVHLRGGPHDCL